MSYQDIEPNKYTLTMASRVWAKELYQYEIYAYSEEEAISKLENGEYYDPITSLEITDTEIQEDLLDTIQITACEPY